MLLRWHINCVLLSFVTFSVGNGTGKGTAQLCSFAVVVLIICLYGSVLIVMYSLCVLRVD